VTSSRGAEDLDAHEVSDARDARDARDAPKSVDGKRLTSPHLVYDRVVNQVTSDTSFAFTEPGRTLTAHGRFASFDGRQVIYNPRYELSAG